MANGGAARQVDYKVTVNNPFQLHQAKLHVVFICVCIGFFFLHFAMMLSVRWLVVEYRHRLLNNYLQSSGTEELQKPCLSEHCDTLCVM